MLEQIDFLNNPRMQELRNRAENSNIESDKKAFLIALVREILKGLSDVTVTNIENGVNINNLDEIKAHLRNELSKANKPITDILSKLNMSTEAQTKFLKEIEEKAENEIDDTVQTVVIKRVKDKTEVTNLSEIVFPSEISVNNLTELSSYLEELIQKVSALKLSVNVETPQVNVPAPIINIPESKEIEIPSVDFNPIVDELDRNLKKLRTNNTSNPIFVRMTDIDKLIKKLDEVRQASKEVMLGFPGSIRIQNATGGVVDFNSIGSSVPTTIGNGKKSVTTAGTRVALASSTAVKSVTIKALSTNTGIIYVGDSTVSSTNGFQLSAGDTINLNISNLSTINLDSSVNGESVTYMWVN